MYGISADELHAMLLTSVASYCDHFGIEVEDILAGEQGRPLEQTIRMILTRATRCPVCDSGLRESASLDELRQYEGPHD